MHAFYVHFSKWTNCQAICSKLDGHLEKEQKNSKVLNGVSKEFKGTHGNIEEHRGIVWFHLT